MVKACTNLDLHSHSCFLLPRPKCSSLELLFSPSPPDSTEKSTHVSSARSLVDRPFMLLAHFRGSYIICVFLLVSPFFSLFNSFSKEMDLWGSFRDCTHFVDPSFESTTQNNFNRVKDNCLFWVSFNLLQLMTCFSLFLLARWYLDILKILFGSHTLFH